MNRGEGIFPLFSIRIEFGFGSGSNVFVHTCIHVYMHTGKSQPKLPPVLVTVKGKWRMVTQSF